MIKAADVSLGPVFIHVYADSGTLGGWWVEGIDAEVRAVWTLGRSHVSLVSNEFTRPAERAEFGSWF